MRLLGLAVHDQQGQGQALEDQGQEQTGMHRVRVGLGGRAIPEGQNQAEEHDHLGKARNELGNGKLRETLPAVEIPQFP